MLPCSAAACGFQHRMPHPGVPDSCILCGHTLCWQQCVAVCVCCMLVGAMFGAAVHGRACARMCVYMGCKGRRERRVRRWMARLPVQHMSVG